MTAKPLLDIGYGTGTPAGMPDFKPLNPWGQAMPKPRREPRPPLFQLWVKRDADGQRVPLGPKAAYDFVETMHRGMVVEAAVSNTRQWWSDAEIVPMRS
jgi:hypothetical protein